jgi:phosphonate transport system substrate-binding protein
VLRSVACVLVVAVVACGSKDRASAPPLRVGLLPHKAPAEELRELEPFARYLEASLDSNVELVMATSYDAAVDAMCAGKVDVQMFGGLTYLMARKRCGATPLVQRDRDQQYHSVFVTAKDSKIESLADLKGRSFAFATQDSTSGHLMPAYYMQKAAVDPDVIAKAIYTGSHDATVRAVAARKVDAGAVSESVYERMKAEHKLDAEQLRSFYTTPPFVDGVWAATDATAARTKAFADAMLALDLSNPQHRVILDRFSAGQFVRAADNDYATLRTIAEAEHVLK